MTHRYRRPSFTGRLIPAPEDDHDWKSRMSVLRIQIVKLQGGHCRMIAARHGRLNLRKAVAWKGENSGSLQL